VAHGESHLVDYATVRHPCCTPRRPESIYSFCVTKCCCAKIATSCRVHGAYQSLAVRLLGITHHPDHYCCDANGARV